jgi:hypothetical protein
MRDEESQSSQREEITELRGHTKTPTSLAEQQAKELEKIQEYNKAEPVNRNETAG